MVCYSDLGGVLSQGGHTGIPSTKGSPFSGTNCQFEPCLVRGSISTQS